MEQKNYLKCESKFKYILFLILYFLLYIPSYLLYHRKKVWLVCERGIDAQDNGYVFYKFLKNSFKKIRPFFIISKESRDISKIEKKDRVTFCSLKHFMLCIGCNVQISSHLFGYCPWSNFMLYLRKHKTHNTHVFLQHGITYNNQYGYYKKVCAALDLFICGSVYEQQYIINTLGYNKDEAILTGFARFDNLHDGVKRKTLLIMPTWRRYLSNVSDKEFRESKYFKSWLSILNDAEIQKICSTCNLNIVFYLHLSLQPYTRLFNCLDGLKIVKYGEETVQNMLKEAAVLLTDYSSVFFDCLYMNKQIILYQFDKDDFKKGHYSQGYIDELDDDVIIRENTKHGLVEKLREIITRKEYKNIEDFSSKFFKIKDANNCERIYRAIASKL